MRRKLSHYDSAGRARMVDVSAKTPTVRRAEASAFVTLTPEVVRALPENPKDSGTADGRPATRAAAHARLARMLCADAETCSEEETRKLALRTSQRQGQPSLTHTRASMRALPRWKGV